MKEKGLDGNITEEITRDKDKWINKFRKNQSEKNNQYSTMTLADGQVIDYVLEEC